jgi:hypothetical protein
MRTFLKVGTCSEALCNVIGRAFGNPLVPEENASWPFAGGIMQHGYQCGLIWGAAFAAGARAYRLLGATPKAEAGAVLAGKKLIESFRVRNRNINCLELIEADWRKKFQVFEYFLKGGAFSCFYMAARYAPVAFREINAALSDKDIEAPSPPVSCASMMARKMGASDMRAVMAAGLAGGIGLCGGACGALTTAIWIIAMRSTAGKSGKFDYKDPALVAAIERFLKCTDYEFECSAIVGRRFENVADHAAYLHGGGCSQIIEALAAE